MLDAKIARGHEAIVARRANHRGYLTGLLRQGILSQDANTGSTAFLSKFGQHQK